MIIISIYYLFLENIIYLTTIPFKYKNEKIMQFEIIKCFPEDEKIMMNIHREIKEQEKNSIHEITYTKNDIPLISIKRKDIVTHLAIGFHKVVYNIPRNTRVYFLDLM